MSEPFSTLTVTATEGFEVRRFEQRQYEEDRFQGKIHKRFTPKGNVMPLGQRQDLPAGTYKILEVRRWREPNGVEVLMLRFNGGWWVRCIDDELLQTPVDELFVSSNCRKVSEVLNLSEPAPPRDKPRW
jgi:hypothetical protein